MTAHRPLAPRPLAWRGFDGAAMAGAVLGPEQADARPIILLHGLFSNAALNWQRHGTAAAIAATGPAGDHA